MLKKIIISKLKAFVSPQTFLVIMCPLPYFIFNQIIFLFYNDFFFICLLFDFDLNCKRFGCQFVNKITFKLISSLILKWQFILRYY